MSSGAPKGFNVTTTQHAVSPPPNGAGITKAAPGPTEVQVRERRIGPLTQFNPDSGMVEADPASPWGGQAKPLEPEPVKPADPAAPSRRDAWKAEQDKIKAERAAKSAKALEERQPLAREFLKKGDLAGAAKALGMTPAEFREYAQNVLLTMPTPDKELTPEQKREADEKAFRESQEAFRKEQEAWRFQVTAENYIRDNIRPVLADKEAYEFISQQAPGSVEAYIYRFMNDHYVKTQETLNVKDVADTVELELEKAAVATFERNKGLKKFAKVLKPERAVAEVEEPQLGAENVETPPAPAPRRAPERPAPERPAPRPLAPRSEQNGARIPFALMSREERLAAMREEDELNPR